jgi:hypothetical protein
MSVLLVPACWFIACLEKEADFQGSILHSFSEDTILHIQGRQYVKSRTLLSLGYTMEQLVTCKGLERKLCFMIFKAVTTNIHSEKRS